MNRKLQLLTAFLFLSFFAFSQDGFAPEPKLKGVKNYKKSANDFSKKKAYVSGWYSPTEYVTFSNISSSLSDNRLGFIANDTSVKSVDENSEISYNFWFGYGQVLDPKDDIIALTQQSDLQLSRFNSYYLDSIRFPYSYTRMADSQELIPGVKTLVVDTLYIAFYKGNQITRTNWVNEPQDKVSFVRYDNNTKSPSNYTEMMTILLTGATNQYIDTTAFRTVDGVFENSVGINLATIPAPANFKITVSPAGTTLDNLVGVAVKFASGVPTILNGDTAVRLYQKDPATFTGRRTNGFTFNYIQNTVADPRWSNPTFYNNSQVMPAWAAYGQSTNWRNIYVPSAAFAREIFVELDMHLTNKDGIPAGTKEQNVNIKSLYPNPTKENATLMVNLPAGGTTKVVAYDITGKTVYSSTHELNKGESEINMNLSHLTPGVYFINVVNGNSTVTEKLMVTK